jgi:hypothetical protein
MRNQLRPSIEGLESRALLSTLATGLTTHAAVDVKITPQRPARLAAESDLAVTLTTNQSSYNPGQIDTMTLKLTNTSTHAIILKIGPSIDGFNIRHNGNLVWVSNPPPQPDYILLRTLQPGQSMSLTAKWTVGAPLGTFVTHNQLFPSGPTATFNVTKPIPPGVPK